MRALAQIVLLYSVAMLGVHLVSSWILRRRWVSEVALLRFEAAYYALLVAYVAWTRTRGLMVAIAVLAAIHLVVWVAYEVKRPAASSKGTLIAVQVFDWGEAVALGWIAWWLMRSS